MCIKSSGFFLLLYSPEPWQAGLGCRPLAALCLLPSSSRRGGELPANNLVGTGACRKSVELIFMASTLQFLAPNPLILVHGFNVW